MPFGLWVDVCRSSFAVRRSPFVVHRSSFALCIRRSSFVVRICRSTFADHRSVIIFSIPLSFIICVRSSIGVNLLCSCFAPPLLSRLGNIIVLLLIIGFAAFAMFDVPIFTIFARLGCFCKDFRVGSGHGFVILDELVNGDIQRNGILFVSQPCSSWYAQDIIPDSATSEVGFILSVQCSLVAIEVSSHMPFGLWVDVCRSSFAVRRSPFVVHRSSFALCIRRSSFVVRICRSTFADHRSVIIFSIPLSFIICVRSSIGVNLLCSCFAPPLLSRLGNIIVLLLIIGFAAFAMFDVPIFTIFARLGCFCKDFRVGSGHGFVILDELVNGDIQRNGILFVSQPCSSWYAQDIIPDSATSEGTFRAFRKRASVD
ncbi:hypothetical protein DEO72_LG5g1824 [Vigna unguiculata]|uniref:Uncharacterized protein n=1 Tax=Vigna unguiculata TaxID=3917 RepID=A0A4D6LZH2_VIGUN|nr:hypothetical protein DEO72_LG5g1824 [Vigna unguiculata]